jgi:hypothetical protein
MTWQSKIMPDDAPELVGSLVGSMLKAEPPNSNPTPNDLPIRSSEQPPLCAAMADAYYGYDENTAVANAMACAVDVARDWLTPEEQNPYPGLPPQNRFQWFRLGYWQARQDIRALLTEQACIARGEQ